MLLQKQLKVSGESIGALIHAQMETEIKPC